MTASVFSVHGASLFYGEKPAVFRAVCDISKGEFVSIIGPNGSGKTTLLSILAGSRTADQGSVLFHGREISAYSAAEKAVRRSCAFIPGGILPAFTVREYVEQRAFARRKMFEDNFSDDQVLYAVSLCGIAKLLDRTVTTLSSGEFQRVTLAGAIAQSRETIILDEPAAHLDPAHVSSLNLLLSRLNSEGSTIISAMHDINAALSLSSRIIGMKEGVIVFNGTPGTFISSNAAEMIFDIKAHPSIHPVSGKPYIHF